MKPGLGPRESQSKPINKVAFSFSGSFKETIEWGCNLTLLSSQSIFKSSYLHNTKDCSAPHLGEALACFPGLLHLSILFSNSSCRTVITVCLCALLSEKVIKLARLYTPLWYTKMCSRADCVAWWIKSRYLEYICVSLFQTGTKETAPTPSEVCWLVLYQQNSSLGENIRTFPNGNNERLCSPTHGEDSKGWLAGWRWWRISGHALILSVCWWWMVAGSPLQS